MEEGTVLVPTAVRGTLPEGVTGLLIGRSSNYKKGLEGLPGVIDTDYQGEIKIMVKNNQTYSHHTPRRAYRPDITLAIFKAAQSSAPVRKRTGRVWIY